MKVRTIAEDGSFVTKDSGKRESYATGMVRDTNDGKARWDLLLVDGLPYGEQMLTRLAMLLTRGAQKYAARNWEKAKTREELERARESAHRHLMQYLCGMRDEDHAAAVIFNLMEAELVEYRLREKQPDGLLRVDQTLTEEEAANLRAEFKRKWQAK